MIADWSRDRAAVVNSYRRHVNRGLARLGQLMGSPLEVRSEGCHVYDSDGTAYLDCGGYGVFILGHCHPEVVAAATRQLQQHPVATRLFLNPQLAAAAEALARVTPEGLEYVYFASSGAEAVETGIKLARLGGARKLVAMESGFHGKTLGALSVTGRPMFRDPFQPLLPEVAFVPFGDIQALESVLAVSKNSCVIMEPVQAEGGVNIPPPGYLTEVQRLCRANGAFLILDEIQTGLGRLGAWWGAQREGVVPDVLLAGKALGGGVLPVSAAIATPEAFRELNRDPYLHTSTFGGSPLAAATAAATIGVMEREAIPERARELGARLLSALTSALAQWRPGLLRDIRGLGLLIGLEFAADHLAGEFMLEMLSRRVIVSHSLNATRVVRFTPPALLADADVDHVAEAATESAQSVADRYQVGSGRRGNANGIADRDG
jgi:putrescine aminotransferase